MARQLPRRGSIDRRTQDERPSPSPRTRSCGRRGEPRNEPSSVALPPRRPTSQIAYLGGARNRACHSVMAPPWPASPTESRRTSRATSSWTPPASPATPAGAVAPRIFGGGENDTAFVKRRSSLSSPSGTTLHTPLPGRLPRSRRSSRRLAQPSRLPPNSWSPTCGAAALRVDRRVAAVILLGGDAGLRSGEIRALPPFEAKRDLNMLHIDRQEWNGINHRLAKAMLAHAVNEQMARRVEYSKRRSGVLKGAARFPRRARTATRTRKGS